MSILPTDLVRTSGTSRRASEEPPAAASSAVLLLLLVRLPPLLPPATARRPGTDDDGWPPPLPATTTVGGRRWGITENRLARGFTVVLVSARLEFRRRGGREDRTDGEEGEELGNGPEGCILVSEKHNGLHLWQEASKAENALH